MIRPTPRVALILSGLLTRPGQPCEITVLLDYEVVRPGKKSLARPGWFRSAHIHQSLVAKADHYLLAEATKTHGIDPSHLPEARGETFSGVGCCNSPASVGNS